MANRRYDPEASREDILHAAERLFAEHGYGDVSTSAIAEAAGVSQSQIHYHFKTKRELWSQVFQLQLAEYFAVQSRMLGTIDVEGVEVLTQSIGAYFRFCRDNPQFVKLLGRAQLDDIEAGGDATAAELVQRGIEAISRAQQAGQLRADLPPQFILLGFLSMVIHWFQCRKQYLPDAGLNATPQSYDGEYLDFIVKVYLRGITP